MVKEFHRVISTEIREQMLGRFGRLPGRAPPFGPGAAPICIVEAHAGRTGIICRAPVSQGMSRGFEARPRGAGAGDGSR